MWTAVLHFLLIKICFSRRNILLSVVGQRLSGHKNGYALFHIAADDIPSKMVFAGYRFYWQVWYYCFLLSLAVRLLVALRRANISRLLF